MTFLSPWFLWALGGVALPLLLHLVRRRRIRVVPWAAWRFLMASQQRLKRRLRIEQLLLAALRAAIIALIVLAFSRPVVRTRAAASSADGPVHAVIALDISASMGFEREGRSDFARAQEVAETIVRKTLKQGDTVSIALISSSPSTPLKHPSHDLDKAANVVRNAKPSALGTDYDRAARLCLDLCAASRSARKEVFIVTDAQRTGFETRVENKPVQPRSRTPNGQPAAKDTWGQLARMARVTWINVAPKDRPNVSASHPVVSREMITPNVPVRIEAPVVNRTGASIESASARLEVDGRVGAATPLRIRGGGSEVASFVHAFASPGVHTGRIIVEQPDGLTADNATWFAVRVRPALRVLVIGPSESGQSAADSLYVATALAPTGASEGQAANITATVRTVLGESGPLSGAYDVVVLAGARSLSPAEARRLRSYVSSGGGLLVFPSAAGASGLTSLWSSASEPLVPFRLGDRKVHSLASPAGLDAASVAHPSLMMFRTTEESELSTARLTTTYDVDTPSPLPPPAGGGGGNGTTTGTLLRFGDGRDAIVEAAVGEGKVVLCAFPAGISGGDLPLKAAYVPLLHQLVSYLAASDPTRRMVTVGGTCALRFGIEMAGKRFMLTPPAEGPMNRTPTGPGQGADTLPTQAPGDDMPQRRVPLSPAAGPDSIVVRCPATTNPGPHTVSALDASGQVRGVEGYVANVAEDEGDLTTASEEEIAAQTGSIPMAFATDADNIERVVRANRFGNEYWAPLLMGALALMAVEAYLARAFGRRS